MIFNLANPHEIIKYDSFVDKLRRKQSVVEVKEKKSIRTLKQNSYLHILLSYFACEYGCSTEEAKLDFYKKTCNRDLYVRQVKNKYGKEVQRLRSSRELDKLEMKISIDRFRNWSASEVGIYLPSPQEHDFIIHCQQIIEQNKEFIEQIED